MALPMPGAAKEHKASLLDRAAARAAEQAAGAEAALLERFLRFYYAAVPADDLRERTPEDLAGAAMAHLGFARQRAIGQAKIRAYNPEPARHGWHSSHSVVEVVNDDMPFLIDSLSAALNEMGLTYHLIIHPLFRAERAAGGDLVDLMPITDGNGKGNRESYIHIEIDQRSNEAALKEVEGRIGAVLGQVRTAVADWRGMVERLEETVARIEDSPPPLPGDQIGEVVDFLRWVGDNHFTFLGTCDYDLIDADGEPRYRAKRAGALGLLRDPRFDEIVGLDGEAALPPEVQTFALAPRALMITKSKCHSPVHRPAPMDSIDIKLFDETGRLVGERRFIGLFTSTAYHSSPLDIPLLRRRVRRTIENSGFAPDSHDGKALINILETFPRDELFQMSSDELFEISLGILHLQERQRTRLFVRRDPYERHVSCLVYVPRDRFNTDLRVRIQSLLLEAFAGTKVSFAVQVSDEALARLHFVVETVPGVATSWDVEALERRIAEAAQTWPDSLGAALIAHYGESRGLDLAQTYAQAFPTAYREEYAIASALEDIEKIESIATAAPGFAMHLYAPYEQTAGLVKFKLYHACDPVPLSDILPLLENMGFRVIGERPALVEPAARAPVWIHDFNMVQRQIDDIEIDRIRDDFHDAFARVWTGEIENDTFNRLVIQAGLNWREIVVVRALCKYLRQTGIPFSQDYMADTLARNAGLARRLLALFSLRFDPATTENRAERCEALRAEILEGLEAVASLDEDRIVRRYLNLILAMVRTNYFQTGADGAPKPYLAFKFDSAQIEDLPLPRPFREIFVYSPRMEGIHLRGGKVARGGIRWSDRREDFRTEILGLMKAQMVKNAVIVPVGAKGGFVCKQLPQDGARDAVQEEGIACYKILIEGLLDLTDNLDGETTVRPERVVRYDDDDPYLVVAADKGTATFSDIANGLSLGRGFWLGDAFASGGAAGYDHKKMGITARGAWVSVRRHLSEAGIDPDRQDFTVVGVGDMSGDVFGNGMILSDRIRLVAAFNHRHIFIDPEPDPAKSFAERQRLFALPRSNWSDYDPALISAGGGVFERKAKAIRLSPEVRARLDLAGESVTPNELIRAILKARADLLWLGGIGTYVKAREESHADVGDHTNDAVRVNAHELRCAIVGEGANLGFTQRARVAYALGGGRINTDAIDNSAGVDCSDHEVNIKIALNPLVASGAMTLEERNALLAALTDDVAEFVLRDNYLQTQALSGTVSRGPLVLESHARLIRFLERQGKLNREIEFLPDDEEIARREKEGLGLTRPELAVLLAYTKIDLFAHLMESDIGEDAYLAQDLVRYFPPKLAHQLGESVYRHRLRAEIIATSVANSIINRTGPSFLYRVSEASGNSLADVSRAYIAARTVFGLREVWADIEALDHKIPPDLQYEMYGEANRLLERGTIWFLRNCERPLKIEAIIDTFAPGIGALASSLEELVAPEELNAITGQYEKLLAKGVPSELARRIAHVDGLIPAPAIVGVAAGIDHPLASVGKTYFALGVALGFDWLREHAALLKPRGHWQRRAISAIVDDLYSQQTALTAAVLRARTGEEGAAAVSAWMALQPATIARTLEMIEDLRKAQALDVAMLAVANRQYRSLIVG